VHDVLPPYKIGLGLQFTDTETVSFVAAYPDGTSKVTNSNATAIPKMSRECILVFVLRGEESVTDLRSTDANFRLLNEKSKATL
jgi:hypothetical protein